MQRWKRRKETGHQAQLSKSKEGEGDILAPVAEKLNLVSATTGSRDVIRNESVSLSLCPSVSLSSTPHTLIFILLFLDVLHSLAGFLHRESTLAASSER